ncbi:MAG: S26 family signal peptidase [Thermoplasmata archaeon]
MSRPLEDDDPEELDADDGDDQRERAPAYHPRRSRGTLPRRHPRPEVAPRRPLRAWRPKRDSPEDEAEENARAVDEARQRAALPRLRFWRFRDSFWFAPLVALILIVIILGSLVAYTGQWPPVYVVESPSMQHGASDQVGLINTGDLVLSKNIAYGSIVSYVVGATTGYATYGEYGDVILYHPNGGAGTPVIHRAILYLDYNPSNQTYNATSLNGLPCGTQPNSVYSVSTRLNGCGTVGLTGVLTLYNIGWKSVLVQIELTGAELGTHSGFVTLGDNNFSPSGCTTSCSGETDQAGMVSQLVSPSWVVGVARGMIPWFGAIRLLIGGSAGSVPPQSWEFLALTIVGVLLASFGLHYAWSSFREPDPRRAAERARRDAQLEAEGRTPPSSDSNEDATPHRRWFWSRARDEDGAEADGARSDLTRTHPHSRTRAGRPKPTVRRATPSAKPTHRRRRDSDDDDL